MPTKASQQCRLTGLFLSYWVVTGASFMFLLNEKKNKSVGKSAAAHSLEGYVQFAFSHAPSTVLP